MKIYSLPITIVALSVSAATAATTTIDVALSKNAGSRLRTSEGSIAPTADGISSSSGSPASATYTVSGLTLDADGVANDSFTITLQLTGTAGGTVNGFGASFQFWGINQTGGGTGSLLDPDETIQFAITGTTLSLSGGNAGSTIAFDGFKGFGILNVAAGETFDITGTDDNNTTNFEADPLPTDTSDTNVHLYTFSGGDGLEDSFTISGNSGAMRYGMANAQVTITTVPEPSTTALLGLSGLALILRRKK